MKLFVFIVWIFVYIQVKQSEVASIKVHPERMKPKGGAESIPKRQDPKPTGWLWCSDKEPNMTFSYKPCPGDPELEECLRITNVSRKDVIKLMEGNWKKPRESVKKWAFCYLSKNGVMSTAGVLRQGAVLRNIPDKDKANVEKTINKCLFKTAHDPVKTAWHYLTCFRAHQPKYAKIANLI